MGKPDPVKEELFACIQIMQALIIPVEDLKSSTGSESKLSGSSSSLLDPTDEVTKQSKDEEWIVADESNPEGIISENDFESDTRLFESLLSKETIDLEILKSLVTKKNVPLKYRGLIWKLLLGYFPPIPSEWARTVIPLRARYFEKKKKFMEEFSHFDTWDKTQRKLYNEIKVDIPRTYLNGFKTLCKDPAITPIIARVLYIWSSENTISYYQGMCELVYMLLVTFLGEHPLAKNGMQSFLTLNLREIEQEFYDNIEADVFYSFDSLMNCFKSVFTEDVMKGTYELTTEISRILQSYSPKLSNHLTSMHCNMLDFSIRWIICMFVREFKVPIVMKLWDLLFSVGEYFPVYVLYLSASLIMSFSSDMLKIKDPTNLIIYTQKLNLEYWSDDELKTMISVANEILEKDVFRPLEYRFSYKPVNHIKEMYKSDFIKVLKGLYGDDAHVTYDEAKVGITASLMAVTLISAATASK